MILTHLNIDPKICTKRLVEVLRATLIRALVRRYEFVTPELLLLAITDQPCFKDYCRKHHFNRKAIERELIKYLEQLDTISDKEQYPFLLSMELGKMIAALNNWWKFHQQKKADGELCLENDFTEFFNTQYDEAMSLQAPMVQNEEEDVEDEHVELDDKIMDNEIAPHNYVDYCDINHVLMAIYHVSPNSMAKYILMKHLGNDIDHWNIDLTHTHLANPNITKCVKAEAIVNGKRIDIDSSLGEEILKTLIMSPHLMMANMARIDIGNNMTAEDENETGKRSANNKQGNSHREKEPWEQLVICLNDTYQQRNPLIGREKELNRCIRILCRKDKNNPLFIGEPGVGKTALIHGLARMIEEGLVPQWMQGHRIYAFDLTSMIAGTSIHGEFEKRMKMVLDGASRRGNCILYIDEIHNVCASGNNNTMNVADMMKPYLEDGRLRFIGCTTYQDYAKTMANKKSMTRRFGLIDVKEPTTEECVEIVKGLLPRYEKHHGVRYAEEAVRYAVEQSSALIHDRYLPDKAIDIIDEAGAYRQQNPLLNKQGRPKAARFQTIDKTLIRQILTDVCRIDAKALAAENNAELKDLDKRISNEIYGQDEAIRQIVRSVMMSKAGLMEPNKPIASLLFVGPTGVGKTEVCKVLAKELGIELVRLDMSEYTEKHSISKLIGSPAGYVGYDEGGQLTDAIRRTPNCVLLLDEIEKAHNDIYNILLQVMDYAKLTDNKGNKADFSNVILVMTSNAGAQYAAQASIGFGGGQNRGQAMLNTVKKTFKPEFINRLTGTVVFNDMDRNMASLILDKKLHQLMERLKGKQVEMTLTQEAHEFLLDKGFDPKYGAREMDRTLQHHLTPLLMHEILFGKLVKGGKATISLKDNDLTIN